MSNRLKKVTVSADGQFMYDGRPLDKVVLLAMTGCFGGPGSEERLDIGMCRVFTLDDSDIFGDDAITFVVLEPLDDRQGVSAHDAQDIERRGGLYLGPVL